MSFGSKPQTVDNDPYKNMPSWVRDYYQSQIANAGQSDNRADALRTMFSGLNRPEHDFVRNHSSTAPVQPASNPAPTQQSGLGPLIDAMRSRS